jgi:hypothetical protein
VIDLLHLDEPISAHRISLTKKVAAFLTMVLSSRAPARGGGAASIPHAPRCSIGCACRR